MDTLPVMELFYTVQGEGFHSGKPAYFVRLAGCDIGCHWCDVKESWDAAIHKQISIEDIVQHAASSMAEIVVITGGEPLLYNLDELTRALQKAGLKTHLETAGANEISGIWDWVCLSPKKFKKPLAANLLKADELKVIVFNNADFSWAEEHNSLVSDKCIKFLQPEWSKTNEIANKLVDYVKKHPNWRISIQTHKYLDIP